MNGVVGHQDPPVQHRKQASTSDGQFARKENDSIQYKIRFNFSRCYFARHDDTVRVFKVSEFNHTIKH